MYRLGYKWSQFGLTFDPLTRYSERKHPPNPYPRDYIFVLTQIHRIYYHLLVGVIDALSSLSLSDNLLFVVFPIHLVIYPDALTNSCQTQT
jgi:hypothetical protein